MTCEGSNNLFLGFDLSTQQLKIIVIDETLRALNTYSVEFDTQFKEKYKINKGVLTNEDSGEILSPVHMWLEAIDHVFTTMKKDGFPFAKVKGLSGSGMQHGSVFWSNAAESALKNLENSPSLSEGLSDAFASKTSPNWQDHSTGQEIKDFELVTNGPDGLAKITGSRAHYRFTGLQIRKLAVRSGPDVYKATKRISLVSSFVASILLGHITTIEEADACGMNLYSIKDSDYDDELLALAAGVHPKLDGKSQEESKAGVQDLKKKLGKISPVSFEGLGNVSSYFVKKYGFAKDTRVYSFTGDNLATIISLPLQKNDVLVSLGTSTTVLLVTENYNPSSQYHVFKHPTIDNAFMGMLCYSNGALAREKVRDKVNRKYGVSGDSWDKFDEILDKSENFDNKLGIYFDTGEIIPNALPQFKRMKLTENGKAVTVPEWDADEDVSSIVESQTISCRLRAGPMLCGSDETSTPADGAKDDEELKKLYEDLHAKFGDIETDGKKQTYKSLTSRPRKIFFVGGASRNKSIIRKMGSIMGATEGNYQVEIPNACALGGAFKASWSYECEQSKTAINFNEYLNEKFDFNDIESLQVEDKWTNYFPALGLLAELEASLDK